ncbi:MAG: hypothetical protein JO264_09570 [Acidisphaera sp.]|nr:hypothetical protein [Acidisphaera sp.]
MALSAELLRWLALALLGVMMAASACAQPNSRDFDLGAIVPTPVAVGEAIQRARAAHCGRADCLALYTIFGTYRVIGDSTATPMGMGGWTPTTAREAFLLTRPATINRRLRATLLSHPDLFPAIRARAENLAAHYDSDADVKSGDEYFFVNSLIQMVMLIDTRSPDHCLPKVLGALLVPRLPIN